MLHRFVCVVGIIAAGLLALSANASAAVYPNGGSAFAGSAEGWEVGASECNVLSAFEIRCATNGSGYDAATESLAARAHVAMNLLGTFKATATLESPTFTAVATGAGTLALMRSFDPGELTVLAPHFSYAASLIDRTTGAEQRALTETLETATPSAAESGSVSLIVGHVYAVQISTTDISTVLGLGLLGEAVGRFDNVAVTGPDAATDPGSNGGGSADGGQSSGASEGVPTAPAPPTSPLPNPARVSGTIVGPATLKGDRLTVKAKCSAACGLTIQGMLNRHSAATGARLANAGSGRPVTFALKLKQGARRRLAARKTILLKLAAADQGSRVTAWESVKLARS